MNKKQRILWFTCLISTLLFSACAWKTEDLSEKEPLKSYIGTSESLRVPMTLLIQRKHTYRFVPYTIEEGVTKEGDVLSWEVRKVCNIPVGTIVSIEAAKMIFIEGGRSIYLIGSIENPETNEPVEFEIYFGTHHPESKKLSLRRMPWEDRNLPDYRDVPLTKRLFWSDWLL